MSSREPLPLRGHHFLCTLHYRGAGYSTRFTENFTALCGRVRASGDLLVQVVSGADAICTACPSLGPEAGLCEYQASVAARDAALLEGMGWRPGQVMSLASAHWAILKNREALMRAVCGGCDWWERCATKGPFGLASPLTRIEQEERPGMLIRKRRSHVRT